jgi:deoxyhypusine synthase
MIGTKTKKTTKKDLLKEKVCHIDIKKHNVIKLVEDMGKMAFSSRELARAAEIYRMMLNDKKCSIILCLAGSLFSAGLKKIVVDMIKNNMVDAIVSTGAIIVDQDFFEGLGFSHYKGRQHDIDDNKLRNLAIDRIYDTFIDEDQLKICDETVSKIADTLEKKPYSSREFIYNMGKYLSKHAKNTDSVVLHAYKKGIPIFVPAFSDCSAGLGLALHQWKNPGSRLTIDSIKDFVELIKVKIKAKDTGILMIGGGVPKNFTQDVVIGAELVGKSVPMHKYAVQITVADVRDGALSGSTLKEASSWGKVETTYEQMVYSEATLAFPLIAAYAYHKKAWKNRKPKHYCRFLDK